MASARASCAATFVGHFLSASALLYASTGDADSEGERRFHGRGAGQVPGATGGHISQRLPHDVVGSLWKKASASGRRSTQSTRSWPACSTCIALPVTRRRSKCSRAWRHGRMNGPPRRPMNRCSRFSTVEFGGIAETLYNLAASTGNDRWAKVGDRFQKKSFINPLALRRDELRGLHANTHIPQAIAAARRYEISGDTRFHDVADYFFHEVSDARSYVTGGTSNAEGWLSPPRQLASEWKASANTAECCCAYNMLKLARHLYGWHPRAGILRLLRAPPAESPHRHDPAERRNHAVLPVAHARRLEDLQHRGPDVLVLHGHRHRGIREADRQHLLARR